LFPSFDTAMWWEMITLSKINNHPEGSRGIMCNYLSTIGCNVFRFNEFSSDRDHLFEDVLGGRQGSDVTEGFPGRHSEVYGNKVAWAADDLIEADKPGPFIKIYANHLDRGFQGISIAPFKSGPGYVYRNVFDANMSAEFHEYFDPNSIATPQILKHYGRGMLYYMHNSAVRSDKWGYRFFNCDLRPVVISNMVFRNNITLTYTAYAKEFRGGESGFYEVDYDYNRDETVKESFFGCFYVFRNISNGSDVGSQWARTDRGKNSS